MPDEIKKSQAVRLWDVFGLGPGLLYIGYTGNLKNWEKYFLIFAGYSTIYYNGKNYLENRRLLNENQ